VVIRRAVVYLRGMNNLTCVSFKCNLLFQIINHPALHVAHPLQSTDPFWKLYRSPCESIISFSRW